MTEENSNPDYTKIKIKALEIYGAGYGLDIYFRLNEQKFIKINHKEDCGSEVLDKYSSKGVEELYLKSSQYDEFVTKVREELQAQIEAENEPESEEDAKIKTMSAAHEILKTVFSKGYLTEDSKALAQSLSQGTVKMISKYNIMEEFERFKKTCAGEYLRAVLTSYIVCCVIDTFSWSNDAVKQKVVLASLLCDITLNQEDFDELDAKKDDVKALSAKIQDHPIKVAGMIAQEGNFVASETLTIIKEHHERPNGKGFPHGINYRGVTQLSAIYIICNYFVERMFPEMYSEVMRYERMEGIVRQIAEKFYSGTFRKASEALENLLLSD